MRLIKGNPVKFTQYLKDHPVKFIADLDEVWAGIDTEKQGFLTEQQALLFVRKL